MAEVQKVIVQIEADTDAAKAEVNSFKKAIEDGIADALKEAGGEAEKFESALKDISKTGGDGFKSLRTQIKEAKTEAQGLAQKFGETSKQALDAQKKVALLTEEMDDFNQRVKALNPEAKFNAASDAISGMIGGLQGVTGAMQLFGSESEEVEKIAMKLQGALNLAQGINSVMGLKDAFANLRISLGLATVAQNGLTAAEITGTTATRALTAALAANPFTAAAVALAALVSGMLLYAEATDDAAEKTAALKKKWDDFEANRTLFYNKFNEAIEKNLDLMDFEIEKAEARGESEKTILELQKQRTEGELRALDAATRTGRATLEDQAKIDKQRREAAQRLELINIRLDQQIKKQRELAEIERIKKEQAKGDIDLMPDRQQLEKETLDIVDTVRDTINSTDIPPIELKWEKTPAEIREDIQFSLNILKELSSTFAAFNQAKYDEELMTLEDRNRRKAISEEEYQRKVRKIRRKAAEDEKKTAIFLATINAAQAIIAALGTTPAPARPAAVILASVIGAANIAKILAAPLPKYAKGTLNVGGGSLDAEGGQHAIIHKGEAIIPKDRNRAYHPAIKAIYNKKISPREINAFVESRMNKKSPTLTATIPASDLYSLRAPDRVAVKNSHEIAKHIAIELSSRNDLRRR